MNKDRAYLVFIIFMITQTIYQLSITGFLRELILPDLPILAEYSPFVAGVIGSSKLAYDLWGETVNVASRLESHGETMKICCSQEFKAQISGDFVFKDFGEVELKGIGKTQVFQMSR